MKLDEILAAKFVGQTLEKTPKRESFIRDMIYKPGKMHPFPKLTRADISRVIKSVPMVKRGNPLVPLSARSVDYDTFDVEMFGVATTVDYADLENIEKLTDSSALAWLETQITNMSGSLALYVQAQQAKPFANGSVDFKIDGTNEVFTFDYTNGAGLTSATVTQITENSSPAVVVANARAMYNAQKTKGAKKDTAFLSGETNYNMLLEIAGKNPLSPIIKSHPDLDGIYFDGWLFLNNAAEYIEADEAQTVTYAIPAKEVRCVNLAGAWCQKFLPIPRAKDKDITKEYEGIPVIPIRKDDDLSLTFKLYWLAKPFPMFDPNSITKSNAWIA